MIIGDVQWLTKVSPAHCDFGNCRRDAAWYRADWISHPSTHQEPNIVCSIHAYGPFYVADDYNK